MDVPLSRSAPPQSGCCGGQAGGRTPCSAHGGPGLLQDLGALKIPDQYRMTIWRGLQDLKQGHDCGQQLLRSSSSTAVAMGSSGQRVMEAVHFRVRHTITIPNRGPGAPAGPDDWADFGFDLPDCKARRQPIKEEFADAESH